MSLQTSLYRARYRQLQALRDLAIRHWTRSGKPGYWSRACRLKDEAMVISPLCNFVVL